MMNTDTNTNVSIANHIGHKFNETSRPVSHQRSTPKKDKALSPVTLRLTKDEISKLNNLSKGMSRSAYIRKCLFGRNTAPRKVRSRVPVKDQEALALVLGLLGQTRIANNLNQIAYEANCGSLLMDKETENEIKLACAHIAWIRVKLIRSPWYQDQVMILKGSQRAGGTQLALHLLKTDENEHVEVHEVSGFMSDTPMEAFNEAYAISRGTKCKQFLFSLSLSPPEKESVPVEVFENAIADIENKLGLSGQPRVVVFHEKEGRRHAHCVWSRIDVKEMKAVHMSHFKLKLRDISRQLYLKHRWQMPRGLVSSKERNPLNFTQVEWQQAKRIKQDPRAIKEAFQDCWAISDSRTAFTNALEERGYYLAKGDRRGFIAVDWRGEVYAISRWVGVKVKDVKAKFGSPDDLPSVEEIHQQLTEKFTDKLQHFVAEATFSHEKAEFSLKKKRQSLASRQRQEREHLKRKLASRRQQETQARSFKLPTSLKALWFRVTGKYRVIKMQNEDEAKQCKTRDQAEQQKLIDQQLRERRHLQHEFHLMRHQHGIQIKKLNRDMGEYLKLSPDDRDSALRQGKRRIARKRHIKRDI